MIPDDWPLTLPVPFLASSLRRVLHERHEGQIVKAIAAAQNLKVTILCLPQTGLLLTLHTTGFRGLMGGYTRTGIRG